ncbi:MAG: LppX_LprAFG lipoprotein [Thermoactinospora sp.]|nr:LppX_LprAFG lipoprotein [Thermoactinospora sp.]
MVKRLLLLLVALMVSTACAGGGETALPSGPDLMKKTADAMKAVKSASFSIATDGTPQVPLRKADGRITSAGDADGTISVEVFGQLTEMNFVLQGDTVYFKGPTGSYQKMPRAQLMQLLQYDPSQVLSPDKGVSTLLAAATNPTVDGEEGGAYKVTAALTKAQLATLVPGVTQDVSAQLLVDKATSRLTKVTLPLQGGSVIVSLSDYDAAVTVTPPPVG